MQNSFKPAWWLPGPHLQTLWGALGARKISLSIRRERLELPDGDFIDLAWVGNGSGPLVCVLHGLSGGIDSHYVRGILQSITAQGWQGVLMHFRGCSGEPNRLLQSYHSGETSDFDRVIHELMQYDLNRPIAVIGYSLGGNVLLKWLGEKGKECPIKAAVAISVPFELAKTADRLNKGLSKIYQWQLLREISRSHSIKLKLLGLEKPKSFKFRTFWEFDNFITAPLHGFKDADHYYELSSSRQYLSRIQTPTLILHAKNDPFTTRDAIPTEAELSHAITFELTKDGGHVGFVAGRYPWKPEYWLEKRIMEYLKEKFAHTLPMAINKF